MIGFSEGQGPTSIKQTFRYVQCISERYATRDLKVIEVDGRLRNISAL
jgi:hypothetical protein